MLMQHVRLVSSASAVSSSVAVSTPMDVIRCLENVSASLAGSDLRAVNVSSQHSSYVGKRLLNTKQKCAQLNGRIISAQVKNQGTCLPLTRMVRLTRHLLATSDKTTDRENFGRDVSLDKEVTNIKFRKSSKSGSGSRDFKGNFYHGWIEANFSKF